MQAVTNLESRVYSLYSIETCETTYRIIERYS